MKRWAESGFTLLEVLAAVAVAAIALAALLQTDAINHRRALHGNRLLGAVHLAREKMEDLHASGLPAGDRDEGQEGGYRWVRTLGETPYPGVREVTVSVGWEEGQSPRSYDVVAYFPE